MADVISFKPQSALYEEELVENLRRVKPDYTIVVAKKNDELHMWVRGEPDRHEIAGILFDAAGTFLQVHSKEPRLGGTA